jgi:hypothetical protein
MPLFVITLVGIESQIVVYMGLRRFDKIIISNVIWYERDGIPNKRCNSSNWYG